MQKLIIIEQRKENARAWHTSPTNCNQIGLLVLRSGLLRRLSAPPNGTSCKRPDAEPGANGQNLHINVINELTHQHIQDHDTL